VERSKGGFCPCSIGANKARWQGLISNRFLVSREYIR